VKRPGDTDAHGDLYRRAEVAVRAAAAAALERPALALGPKETAEVEMGAAFFGRLAALVSRESQTNPGLFKSEKKTNLGQLYCLAWRPMVLSWHPL